LQTQLSILKLKPPKERAVPEEVMSLNAASDELRETFKLALRRFPAAVSVITSADQNRRHGMTATAVTSLSLDPPSLIVCINQSTLLHDIMLLARRFCVNVLRRDQAALSSAFSGAIAAEERFRLGDWMMSADGVTYLADAQINIFCKKAAAVPYGTHTIFIGEAESVNVRDPIEPLIYQDATYCVSVPHNSEAA
jgi:flavin reductase (DIM6/NTAB) family NADH-FMN oxidoreductase RutF